MSTFGQKRPESRQRERYSPNGPNVTHTRSANGRNELPGTAVYGVQDVPIKKPLRTEFERTKSILNEKSSVPRFGKNCQKREEMESNRPSPIAMNPLLPKKNSRDTPTYKSSPDNPLSSRGSGDRQDPNTLRNSSRFAARLKFEASRANNHTSDNRKFAGQWEACREAKDVKTKETCVLKEHPHGATQSVIHNKRPEGLSLPGLGFGNACRS